MDSQMGEALWNALPPFIGALFGSGFIWAYLEYRDRRKALDVSTAVAITELQSDLLSKLIDIISKSEEFADVRDGKITGVIPTNRLNQLKAQIDLLAADIISCEARLAAIEGRPARDIKVKYVRPAPPTDGSIEYV